MSNFDYDWFDSVDVDRSTFDDETLYYGVKDFSVDSVEELKEELRYFDSIYSIRLYDENDEMIEDFDTEWGEDFTKFDWSEIEELMDEVSYFEVCWMWSVADEPYEEA